MSVQKNPNVCASNRKYFNCGGNITSQRLERAPESPQIRSEFLIYTCLTRFQWPFHACIIGFKFYPALSGGGFLPALRCCPAVSRAQRGALGFESRRAPRLPGIPVSGNRYRAGYSGCRIPASCQCIHSMERRLPCRSAPACSIRSRRG